MRIFGTKFKLRFFTLLSLFLYANLSLALGLSDAELKSNLGERLLVKLDVTDVESTPESSCFSATDIGDPVTFKKANVNLKADSNGHYQLTVSTHDVISEPIVNIRISYHCEPNINRDYVLLLDPVPAPATEKLSANQENTNNANTEPSVDEAKQATQKTRKARSKKSPAIETTEQADDITPEQPTLKKTGNKKRPKVPSSVNAKLLEAYTGKQNSSPAQQTTPSSESTNNTNTDTPHKSADKPFLIISTGNTNVSNGADQPSLSLRLATEIDVNRPVEASETQPLATDTMDEVTVMANRLAHLEKQIVSLQTRNAQLVTEAKIAKEETKFDWMQFSKIALAIMLTLAAIELLRRKFAKKQVKEIWFDEKQSGLNNTSNLDTDLEGGFDFNDIKASSFDEPTFTEKLTEKPVQSENIAKAAALTATAKEENSSVIEDADVFIEHGRPTLAIQLLQNHLSESPAESPAIWLKLLNLLSKEDSETEFNAAVVECNKYFNIKVAKYGSNLASDTSSIEDYPHIVTRLEGVWGSPYAIGFLNDLIFNKRSQPRDGLDQGAFNDLFFLKNIAKNLENIDPTLFKVTPMLPSKTQAMAAVSTVAATNIENTTFNDALFADIEPTAVASVDPKKSKLKDIKRGTKSSFNQFEEVPSYEVNMIHSDELSTDFNEKPETKPELEITAKSETNIPEVSVKDEPLEFDIPVKASTNQTIDDDELFQAEEINFSLPTEKVEFVTGSQPEIVTENIVFDSPETTPNHSLDLEFSLDFPNAEVTQANVEKNKAKPVEAKTTVKNKPRFKNLTESNEIEWNLPEIDIEPKSDK